jgi:hypothetical protein
VPVDIGRVDAIAAAVAGVYRQGETALLRDITDRLSVGLDRTDWHARRLERITALRRAAGVIAGTLTERGSAEVRAAVAAGLRAGRHDAVRELTDLLAGDGPLPSRTGGPADRRAANAVHALADATVRELHPLHAAILPQSETAYRRAIANAAARRITGATNLREAAQGAWAELTARGITGYDDRAGRRWRLHTYVEMATRAAVNRAAVHGLVDEYTAAGVRLVSVDDQPGECWRCRPYEHRVLALWGATGRQYVQHHRGGALVPVDVVATLDEAAAAGLFHPGCRHIIRAYLPGVSILLRTGRTADPAGEAARDRQRAIERALRHWREMETAALTATARRAAHARIRSWDAEMVAHLAEHGLTRKRYREQIGAGHIPPAGVVDRAARRLAVPE